MASEQSPTPYYFLGIVLIAYIIVFIINPALALNSFKSFFEILKRIIPILVIVFLLMVIINYFITPEKLVKHLGKKAGIKSWIISILAGIISTGPIYMWYPLLADLKKKGVREASLAIFLYNRAVKPALIPMLIIYFGLKYTIVLTIVMMIISIAVGLTVEKLVEVRT